MDDLTAEVERDLISGVDSGGNLRFAAFTGVARKLGYSNSCGQSIPLDQNRLRNLQVEAALRRERNIARAEGSGQVLGGATLASSTSSGIPRSSRLLQSVEVVEKGVPMWSCIHCTYQNPESISLCELCGALSDGRMPSPDLISSIPPWICPFCTTSNSALVNQCQVCGIVNLELSSDSIPPHPSPPLQPERQSNLIVLHEDDELQPPSKKIKPQPQLDLDDDMECMWVCAMCTCPNKLSLITCTVCGYKPK